MESIRNHKGIDNYSGSIPELCFGFLFADTEVSEYGVEHLLSGDGVTRYFAECLEHATEVQRDKVGRDVGVQSLQHVPKMGGCLL